MIKPICLDHKEVQNAIEEGVDFQWLTLPTQYSGNGYLKNVKTVLMQLGEPDESGRRKPEPKDGTEKNLDVDLVMRLLGLSLKIYQNFLIIKN